MIIHSTAATNVSELGISVTSALVKMYAVCGSTNEAQKMFDQMKHRDIITWNALILGYAENGEGDKALDAFCCMQSEGCMPDSRSFIAALKGCTRMKKRSLDAGMSLHFQAATCGLSCDIFVATALVDMYGKCGSMGSARRVFDDMRKHDVVAWTTLILGYVENGEARIALQCLTSMKSGGFAPSAVTYIAALKACGMLGALEFGRELHAEIQSQGLKSLNLANSLLDFYGKCGSMAGAQQVFDSLEPKDQIVYGTLMAGYSSAGEHQYVFQLFQKMLDSGVQPDAITFSCLLTTCSHAGLVDKARDFFELMTSKYCIRPDTNHFCCMVDTYGRASKLDEALEFLNSIPLNADAAIWTALLNASCKWKNVQVGRVAFEKLQQLGCNEATTYVEMAKTFQ